MITPSPLTVLLVEDDSNDVFLFQRALGSCERQHSLQVVHDGEEAIAYLQGSGKYADRQTYPLPSLTILDLKLPRKSGLEVLEWLMKDQTLKRIPTVILSSAMQQKEINLAYDLGVNAYLVKPVGFSALQHLVNRTTEYWMLLCAKPDI